MDKIVLGAFSLLVCWGLVVGLGSPAVAQDQSDRSLLIGGAGFASGLVDRWAISYEKTHPGWKALVTGGNTAKGFQAFMRGQLDIVMASRPISPAESKAVASQGIKLASKEVGRAGLAIITSVRNPVDSLTMSQLRDIFTGAAINWSKVGGPDSSIRVLTRRVPDSGAAVLFQRLALNGMPYTPKAIVPDSWSSVILVCKRANDFPIGMAPSSRSLIGVKTLGIRKDEGSPAVMPTDENVKTGAYPLVGPIRLYWDEKNNARIAEFADYCQKRGHDGYQTGNTTSPGN